MRVSAGGQTTHAQTRYGVHNKRRIASAGLRDRPERHDVFARRYIYSSNIEPMTRQCQLNKSTNFVDVIDSNITSYVVGGP